MADEHLEFFFVVENIGYKPNQSTMPKPCQAMYIKVSVFQTTQPSYQKLSINVKHEAQASIDVQSFNAENFKIGHYSKQCDYEGVSTLKKIYLTFLVDYLLPCTKFIPPTKGFLMDGYYTTNRMYTTNSKQSANRMYTANSKQSDISHTALHSTFQVVE